MFSWESIAGAVIAVAMLGAALYKRASTRNHQASTRTTIASGISKTTY